MKVTKAVIPLGGLATRFLPASKAVPKCMFPVVDKPILQYLVEELSASGVTDILILVGRNNEAVMNHFDKTPELNERLRTSNKQKLLQVAEEPCHLANIMYKRVYEPKGVADVILQTQAFVGTDPFFVVFGDELFYNPNISSIEQMAQLFEKTGKSIIGCYNVNPEDVYKYGIMKVNDKNGVLNVEGIVEKPAVDEAPSTLSAVGKYILTPDIFHILTKVNENFNPETNFTEGLNILAQNKNLVACDLVGNRYDTGSKLGYIIANLEYGLRNPEITAELVEYLKTLVNM